MPLHLLLLLDDCSKVSMDIQSLLTFDYHTHCTPRVLGVLGQLWQQQQCVQSAAALCVSSWLSRHPHSSPAHQNKRTCPHRCGGTYVHQQPGHPYKVPWVTVRTHILYTVHISLYQGVWYCHHHFSINKHSCYAVF